MLPKLLLGILGLTAVFAFRSWQVSRIPTLPFTPETSVTTLTPPTQSLQGIILSQRGVVKKLGRGQTEFAPIDATKPILQGEIVITENYARANIRIGTIGAVILDASSEVDFVNLIPENLVIHQKEGNIQYDTTQPLSVRSLHMLLTLFKGSGRVTARNGLISVTISDGEARLAMVDNDNNTHVWSLTEGQTAMVNDEKQTVETNGTELSQKLE